MVLEARATPERLKCAEYNSRFAASTFSLLQAAQTFSLFLQHIEELLGIYHALHLKSEIKYELERRTFCLREPLELKNSRQFCVVEHFDDSFQLLLFSSVSLLMCPLQKEKLEGDNLSYFPTGTFLVVRLCFRDRTIVFHCQIRFS